MARVIRSGEPELLAEMTDALLRSFAQGSEHARFMIEHRYRSAVVAPLLARGRTLGALSVLRLGESERYGSAGPRPGRASSPAARRWRSTTRGCSPTCSGVEQRLEAILVNLAEAITVIDERGRMVFANQAAAELLGVGTPGELTRAAPGDDHAALPRARRAGSRARPREHARRGGCSRASGPSRCWCATSSAPRARSAG